MSITSSEQAACSCGAEVRVDVVDSLNAERHPHLRQAVLDRQLHAARCACGRTVVVDRQFLYVDLGRRQLLGVFPRPDRADPDPRARELEDTYDRWFRTEAPAWVRELAERCLVRACFGLEELREKVVGDAAGLDDLAVEVTKCLVLAQDPRFREAAFGALRLEGVADDALELLAVDAEDQPLGVVVRVPREDVDQLARRGTGELLAAYPGIAVGPHVSMLRLGRPAG